MIHWVRDYLAGLGIDSVPPHDATGQKANLFTTIGPTDRPGIILSGHTDLVPCEDQVWTGDPFRLVRLNDRVAGRVVGRERSW